jgi:hypothetical protein
MCIALASILLLPFASAVVAADAPFTVVSESVKYHVGTDRVAFTIKFNRAADFFTTDEFGRVATSFQYYVVGEDPAAPYPSNYVAVIRGDEIHYDNVIVIRNAAPPDADVARSGGWGTIRGAVAYSLHGRTLRFSAPLALVTDERSGTIDYVLETAVFGSLEDHVEGSFVIR